MKAAAIAVSSEDERLIRDQSMSISVTLRLHHRAGRVVIEVDIGILIRKGSSAGMRPMVRQTKNWENTAMNVLELLAMRLRLAQDQVKLHQVDVYAKD